MTQNSYKQTASPIALWLVPVIAIASGISLLAIDVSPTIAATVGITILTGGWWVTEVLPLWATALTPLVMLPVFGVIDYKTASASLGNHTVLLMLGAFMIAKAMEKSELNSRLAILILKLITQVAGYSQRSVIVAFILVAALFSMWISNTATVLIVYPIALPIIAQWQNRRAIVAVVLGIAYAANLGGMGTPVGTPPNAVFMGIYPEFSTTDISFADWMGFGVPIVAIGIPLIAFWLSRGCNERISAVQLPKLAAWSQAEKYVLVVFIFTVLAWTTRQAPFGGWSALLGHNLTADSTVALAAALTLFILPDGKGGRLLDWETASGIHWGILLLFAGGFCLAAGFAQSGLSEIIGSTLASSLTGLPLLAVLLILCLSISFLTEITTNTATTTLLLPILAAGAIAADLPPETLMIPATLAASCAFMLPSGTAPNAIAFATEKISIRDMTREGLVLNCALAVCIAVWCWYRF